MAIEQGRGDGSSETAASMAKHLRRFNGGSWNFAYSNVLKLLAEQPGLSWAEILRQLTGGLGAGKSHCSGQTEGDLKGT
jgi:hypothetical protein